MDPFSINSNSFLFLYSGIEFQILIRKEQKEISGQMFPMQLVVSEKVLHSRDLPKNEN